MAETGVGTTDEQAILHLKQAHRLLMQREQDECGGGVELADAIDHTAAALSNLGVEI